MSADLSSLNSLEELIKEFYTTETTNGRKYEIERILRSFSEHPTACSSCIFYISNTRNELVLMYCFSILEMQISKSWLKIQNNERTIIRDVVYNMLINCHTNVSNFIRTKLAKLLVLIARNDWPHDYPDFFRIIAKLIYEPSSAQLGFLLLQISSEEMAFPKDSLHSSRKSEIRRFLDAQMPEFFSIIISILSSYKLDSDLNEMDIPSTTNKLTSISIKKSALKNNGPTRTRKKSQSLEHNTSTCSSLLVALNHMTTWVDLSQCSNLDQLLLFLFQLVRLNQEGISELAMSCIGELITSPTFHKKHSHLIIVSFQHLCVLLAEITSYEEEVDWPNDSLSTRLCEFINTFIKSYLKRIENSSHPPIQYFLELFIKFTFNQKSIDVFSTCLTAWNQLVDTAFLDSSHQNEIVQLQRYEGILKLLAENIVRKIQFRFNQSQLESLDDDILDDDFKTEWQSFLLECVELLAKIGQISLQYIFSITIPPLQDSLNAYYSLAQLVSSSDSGRNLQLTLDSETDSCKLHCAMRDLTTLLQVHGRLFDVLVGRNTEESCYDGYQLANKLVQCLQYSLKLQLFKLKTNVESVLLADFVDVLAHSIASVRAFSTWLKSFYLKSRNNSNERSVCDDIILSIIESTVPLYYTNNVPEKILLALSNLVLSFCVTIRPEGLFKIPHFQILFDRGLCGISIPPQAEMSTYKAMNGYLVLPWLGVQSIGDIQEWNNRSEKHKLFIERIISGCKELSAINTGVLDSQTGTSSVEHLLHILTELVISLQTDGVTKSKVIFFESISPFFGHMVQLFPILVRQHRLSNKILEFFLAMVTVLSSQMTFNLVNQLIQNLLHIFTSELIMESLHEEESLGHILIDKFLQILIVVVQEAGPLFKTSVPCLLNLTLHHIYPILAQRPAVEVKPSLFKLLHEILKNHWRLFFRSQVLEAANNRLTQLSATQIQESTNHSQATCELYNEYFVAAMQVYGQSFLQPDIDLFKTNLGYLEQLHQQYQLYSKPIFKSSMLTQTVSVLLHVLIQKSHEILSEDIAVAIYNMSSVDFKFFKDDCLRRFLVDSEGLDNDQRTNLHALFEHEDLPSFVTSVLQFVNDFVFYRNLNRPF